MVAVLALLAATTAAGVVNNRQHSQTLRSLGTTSEANAAVEQARFDFTSGMGYLAAQGLGESPTGFLDYQKSVISAKWNLNRAIALTRSSGREEEVAELESALTRIDEFDSEISSVATLYLSGNPDEMVGTVAELGADARDVSADLTALSDRQRALVSDEGAAAEAAAKTGLLLQVISGAAALVLGAAAAGFTIRTVVAPLAGLREQARAISAGEMDRRAKVTGPTEVSSLAADFNQMAETLQARIAEQQQVEEQMKHLAYHDSLTSLPNWSQFKDRLETALVKARRRRNGLRWNGLAVMFIDLDGFKRVNDTLGHALGDLLLQQMGTRLSEIVREGDIVARVGGDEFTFLLPDTSDKNDVMIVAERILSLTKQAVTLAGHQFVVSSSIGIALYPEHGDNSDTLLRNADTAMYRAKDNGRDRVEFYEATMNDQLRERVNLEIDFRKGLDRGEFVVEYQPLVDCDLGVLAGVEALVRWHHPDRGRVMPGEFIPLAEETGMITALGEFVLREACLRTESWRQSGWTEASVAVNLSARQFLQPDLRALIAQILADTGLPPRCLVLEITESAAIRDIDLARSTIADLRATGLRVAIDDFGTGQSSLRYLKQLAVDFLKVDQTFVRGLPADTGDAAIVSAVMGLARTMGLTPIAEGVENEAQLRCLMDLGYRDVQGFLFSKSVPPEEIERFLSAGHRFELPQFEKEPVFS